MNKEYVDFKNKLKNSRIAVIGIGVSNKPLIEYLYKNKCNVTLFNDKEIKEDLLFGYPSYVGENYLENLKGFDIIFRAPSCLPTKKEIMEEINREAYVTTEVMEVVRLAPCPVIGVTGSDGKTTTTTLINMILKANSYNTFLGGNIGIPLFDKIEEMKKEDIVVLELSSFQLMGSHVSPDIAIITNISPNHLDKHKDYQEYIDSKCEIFNHNDGILVLNKNNDITNKFTSDRVIRYFSKQERTNAFYLDGDYICFQGKKMFDTKELMIRGRHNYENICAAFSAIYSLVDLNKSWNAIKSFSGVEHRLEFVREIDGVKWYNDSVSSSPTRTIAGLNSYEENIVLIAGGYDKNLDYSPLREYVKKKVSKLILFGTTKDKIYNACKDLNIPIYIMNSLEEVVLKAKEVSKSGEVVLFSPASASFDMFKNFADRGIQFKDLVNKL